MEKRLRSYGKILCIGLAALCAAPAPAHAAADPLLADQWALTDPVATGAKQAWTRSTGAGVVVAVLDTGVQLDHPDLAGSLWTNRNEVAGNGRDDDNNGFVDDVNGANTLARNGNVADDHGHGTHVAGIVAARRDNGAGGAGVAPDATIMPIKVLDAAMKGNTTALAQGIRYAVDQGADILNVSINGDGSTEVLVSAVAHAAANGATVVASAGNQSRSIDLLPSFPASLADPALLSVAATDQASALSSLSNFGQAVDLAAPGKTILSTTLGSAYEYRQGTSTSAPFVAGSLALLAAARPDMSQPALRDALLATTRRSPALLEFVRTGRLDVGAAMQSIAGGPAAVAGASVAPVLRLRGNSGVRAGRSSVVRWSATGADSVTTWRVSLDGRVVSRSKAGTTRRVQRRIRSAGRHHWRIVGFDAGGAKVVAGKRSFSVAKQRR